MCEKKRFHGTHERGRCVVSAAAMAGWCGAAVGAARCKEEEEEEEEEEERASVLAVVAGRVTQHDAARRCNRKLSLSSFALGSSIAVACP